MISVSYAKTVYGQKEIDAVVKCLQEGTQMGKYAREFESKIAALFDKKHCLYVNSGSSALYIGMEAFGFKPGSEVITPALTFSTTVGCIVKNGLIPVFVDVGVSDYCIDPAKIEEMISPKTVAIVAPNLIGNICQWDKIAEIAKKYNLKIIEDSADTLGATLNGKSSGAWSDMSITSFYGSHIINCAGNGGALCINDDEQLKRSKLLRSWGRSSSIFDEKSEAIENRFNVDVDGIKYDAKFVFETIGYNLEGSEIGASFGLVQLGDLQNNIITRRKNYQTQTNFFKKYEEFITLPTETENARTGWLAFPIIIKDTAPFERRDFQIFLEKRNIQTRVVFTGNVTRQPGYKNLEMRKSKDLKNSDNIMRGGVLLACHHGLTDEMIAHMHSTVDEFMAQYR
ncbi:MAG: aminotransferase class I/II-fold pyridoxal phosphate-dependent enzyme [Pelagibacterales bacterium]|nr:aminotransferase class I/II-fold pyridoxal phosphate-dependent enzyme [Pelagibacterales bacterium]